MLSPFPATDRKNQTASLGRSALSMHLLIRRQVRETMKKLISPIFLNQTEILSFGHEAGDLERGNLRYLSR